MEEEILRLLYDYSISNRLVDRTFIEKVIRLYADSYQIGHYVNKIKILDINENNNNSLAGYSYNTREIIIFIDKLLEEILDNNSFNLVPNNQLYFYKNAQILHVILHELEHANQAKIIDNEKTLESEILKFTGVSKSQDIISARLRKSGFSSKSIEIFLNSKMKIYNEFYDYAPHERLAEIKSLEKTQEILSPIKKYIPKVVDIGNMKILQNYMKGYNLSKQINSPTIYYLQKQGEYSQLEKYDWYDYYPSIALFKSKEKYCFENRIRYGLPIDSKEYNEMNKKLKKYIR